MAVDHACAYGCQKQVNIPYFLFPAEDNELSEKWMEFVKRRANKDIQVHQYLQLCGNHFSSSDFIEVKCYLRLMIYCISHHFYFFCSNLKLAIYNYTILINNNLFS